ncbi:MAG: hypothetical protein IT376_03490 [Polyangiaceae bacterium]|nr:hypothetical protein [Polyangiaceae bacterium]
MKRRLVVPVSVGVALGIAWACASPGEIDEPSPRQDSGAEDATTDGPAVDSGSGGGGGSGGGWPTGGAGGTGGGWPGGDFGDGCVADSGCKSGECTDVGQKDQNRVCTQPCTEGTACPSGGYCAWIDGRGYTCIPDADSQCAPCTTDADCTSAGDKCRAAPDGSRFCARDCGFDGACPTGAECAADAGEAPDGGVAGDAGGPTKPPRQCVPQAGGSCPCDARRNGVTRTCSKTEGTLTCEGQETCNGATSAWEGCTAGTPSPETCDGADNDCNGSRDDGDPAALCAAQTPVPNASWTCDTTLGSCVIGACTTGFINYPPSLPPSAGCPCPIEASEPANDACATAIDVGSVTDDPASAAPLSISGRLTSDADVDWFRFQAVDFDEATTNNYHVKIGFLEPATNAEFVFDVIRGDACAEPDAAHASLVGYDWCVNGVGSQPGQGEQTCSAEGAIHCGPHTSTYLIRVRRVAGATGTCDRYTLQITGRGVDGDCDFNDTTGQCDPWP